jgi:hypothetical protein
MHKTTKCSIKWSKNVAKMEKTDKFKTQWIFVYFIVPHSFSNDQRLQDARTNECNDVHQLHPIMGLRGRHHEET